MRILRNSSRRFQSIRTRRMELRPRTNGQTRPTHPGRRPRHPLRPLGPPPQSAVNFFMAFINASVPKICVENPVGVMSTLYSKPDQIIQPYQYGHPESKRTCLWLKNLPRLKPTKIVEPEYYTDKDGKIYKDKSGYKYSRTHYHPEKYLPRYANQTKSGQNKLPPSKLRSKIRSLTYPGVAHAMADQWNFQGIKIPELKFSIE